MKYFMPFMVLWICLGLLAGDAWAGKKKRSKRNRQSPKIQKVLTSPVASGESKADVSAHIATQTATSAALTPSVAVASATLTSTAQATSTARSEVAVTKAAVKKEISPLDEDYSDLVVADSGPQDPVLNPKLLEVRNLFYKDQIEESLQMLLSLRDELKNDPNYWLGTATFFEIHATMNAHLSAVELKQREKTFFEATEQLGKLADKILETNPKDYMGRFYKGISSGLRGKFYGERNQIVTAYMESYPFYRQLIKLKEEDPKDNKVLAPLGMFHYMVGLMGSLISTVSSLLGGPTGDIPLSFKELSSAVRVPGFFQINNIYIYVPILLQNRRYTAVDQILKNTFKLYPHNSYLRSFYLESAALNDDSVSRKAYLKELESRLLQSSAILELTQKKHVTYYEEYYALAECRSWMRLGDFKSAEDQFAVYQKKIKRNSPLFAWFDPYLKAMKASFKNNPDNALDLLQLSIEQGFPKVELPSLKYTPEWQSFKNNERFVKMIQQ